MQRNTWKEIEKISQGNGKVSNVDEDDEDS